MAHELAERPPLRGQELIWRQLTELVTGAAGRARTALVLAGPEGSGKTRLLQELAVAGRQAGCIVLADTQLGGAALGRDQTPARPLDPATDPRLVMVLRDGPLSPGQYVIADGFSLLCVGTQRSQPGDQLDGDGTVITVPPLSTSAVRQLVADVGRRAGLPAGLEETVALAAAAAGNPRAIIELVQGLAEERPLRLVLPLASRARIVAQLRAAGPDTRDLIAVAAKLARPCATAEVAQVLGMSVIRTARAVDEAVAHGLLVAGADRIAYPHEQVRALVLSTLAPTVSSAVETVIVSYGQSASGSIPIPEPRLPEPDGIGPAEDADWDRLSAQQQQIAEMVAEGLTNRVIGRRLYLSPYTVKYHLREIFKKLGITSRVQLARRHPS